MLMTSSDATDHRKNGLEKLSKLLPRLEELGKNSDLLRQPMVIQIVKDITQTHHFLQQVFIHMARDMPQYNPDRHGYLLPLSCGHNGVFSHAELAVYEQHLVNINFVK
jgi:hypothetical protein